MNRRFQFSLGRLLIALGLIFGTLINLDAVVHGCDIMRGWQVLFLPISLLFGYVAVCVLLAIGIADPIDDRECKSWRCFAPLRRPQFSLKTLLWLMVAVAAFYAGDRRARNLYLMSVGQWLQESTAMSDQNQKLQTENAALRRQIDADHERWLKADK